MTTTDKWRQGETYSGGIYRWLKARLTGGLTTSRACDTHASHEMLAARRKLYSIHKTTNLTFSTKINYRLLLMFFRGMVYVLIHSKDWIPVLDEI
jgi:hypothetical protein